MSRFDRRRAEEDDAIAAIARGQDDAVTAAHLPPLPQEGEDPLAAIARKQDAAVADARLPPLPGGGNEPRGQAASLRDVQGPDVTAWAKAHPNGLDLGSNEKQLAALRAARDAVRGKRVDVGRPDMPGAPRDFAEINPPSGNSPVDSALSQTKVAGDRASGDRPAGDPDMLAAELLASGRRSREAMNEGTRLIGYAGLPDAQKRSATGADVAANLDAPIKSVQGDRAYAQKQREEGRAAEDQSFQRENQGFAREKMGFARSDQAGKEDKGKPGSDISVRRKAEAIGLYPKELGRIDPATWKNVTADDVDVLLKELDMKKNREAGGAAMDRLFAQQVAQVGDKTAKQPFGEIETIAQGLEKDFPGITTGQYKNPDPIGGLGDRALMMLPGGAGERGVDEKVLRTHKAVQEMTDLIERMRSGAVINDSEARHYTSMLGAGLGQSGTSLSLGLATVMNSIRAKLRNQQSGYNYIHNSQGQTPLDVISGQGGTDFRKGMGGGPQRKKGSDGQMYINRSGKPGDWEAE